MFENILNFFKKIKKAENQEKNSKDAAKERLHLVLMQDRANVSADFLDMMKQEIIEVIKKYIDVDENAIDVRLTNKQNNDGTTGAPALYANIPIVSIKEDVKRIDIGKESSNNKNIENDVKIVNETKTEEITKVEEDINNSEKESNEECEVEIDEDNQKEDSKDNK